MALSWTNWSRYQQCEPAAMPLPGHVSEVQGIVRAAASGGQTVRVAGSGHSFSPIVPTDDVLVSLDKLSGLIGADVASSRATAHGGTKLSDLNHLLDEQGLAMESLGDINVQSVAGAVATGTHGTGMHYGSISEQIVGLELVTADGEVLWCDESTEPEVFRAARVSLGVLGIITKAQFRLEPAYNLHCEHRPGTWDEVVEQAEAHKRDNRHFEFFHWPHTDAVELKFLNQTDRAVDASAVEERRERQARQNIGFRALASLGRFNPDLCPEICRFMGQAIAHEGIVAKSFDVFSSERSVRFNEMEYSVPSERGLEALAELRQWITDNRIAVHFPIEFRYVKADDIPLSANYGRESAAISVHMFAGMDFAQYFDGCEAIFRNHGGRPHWGKLHSLAAGELAPLFPEWESFRAIRERLDPHGVFLTPSLHAMFIGDD